MSDILFGIIRSVTNHFVFIDILSEINIDSLF